MKFQQMMAAKNPFSSGFSSTDFHGFQGTITGVGTIVDWLEEKGYGWVKSGDKRYFAHIKDFEPGQGRPKVGEDVITK